MTTAPTLTTERLTLRPLLPRDFDAFAALHQSDHACWMWAPKDLQTAWERFLAVAGHWSLFGQGWWAVADRDNDAFLGHVGFNRDAPGSEPELAWAVTETAQGHGLAFEAAATARDWGRAHGIPAPISLIDQRNARSIRLAERLGATLERRVEYTPEAVALHYRHPAGGAA